jgi:hypothetical protein
MFGLAFFHSGPSFFSHKLTEYVSEAVFVLVSFHSDPSIFSRNLTSSVNGNSNFSSSFLYVHPMCHIVGDI